MKWTALALVMLAGFLSACSKESGQTAAPPVVAIQPPAHQYPTHAQDKLKTLRIWLGAEELSTEIALNEVESETGMMFRTNMPENSAMLFVFPVAQKARFWMFQTDLPLSVGYIDPQGTLLEEYDMQPHDTNTTSSTSSSILYALEVNQGWFKRHHIEPGTVLRTEYGSFPETFVRHRR